MPPDLLEHPAWRPERANVYVDGRGFLRYGLAQLSLRIVNGKLEFLIKDRHLQAKYGQRVYVEPEELLALCNKDALDRQRDL